jgi:hypothetical protein
MECCIKLNKDRYLIISITLLLLYSNTPVLVEAN